MIIFSDSLCDGDILVMRCALMRKWLMEHLDQDLQPWFIHVPEPTRGSSSVRVFGYKKTSWRGNPRPSPAHNTSSAAMTQPCKFVQFILSSAFFPSYSRNEKKIYLLFFKLPEKKILFVVIFSRTIAGLLSPSHGRANVCLRDQPKSSRFSLLEVWPHQQHHAFCTLPGACWWAKYHEPK